MTASLVRLGRELADSMLPTASRAALCLLVWAVCGLSSAAAVSKTSSGSARGRAFHPEGLPRQLGRTSSIYPETSPVWARLKLESPPFLDSQLYPSFHFLHGVPEKLADAAFAMAASAATGRALTDQWFHENVCSSLRTSCQPEDIRKAGAAADVAITNDWLVGPLSQRKDALAACAGQESALLSALRGDVLADVGIALSLRIFQAYPVTEDAVADVRAVALYGVQGDALLLRDPFDRVPVTYRLDREHLCEVLVAPSTPHWDTPIRVTPAWGVLRWRLVHQGRTSPGPFPFPAPTPSPDIPDSEDRGEIPSCPDFPKTCSLGEVWWPGRQESPHQAEFNTTNLRPRALLLHWGVGTQATEERQWFRSVRTLEGAYAGSGLRSNRVGRLAQRFRRFAESRRWNREWEIRALLSFVQSIPYELIPSAESRMGLRGPISTLEANAGDCDSKSLLAASLLRALGYETALLVSNRNSHAVLGLGGWKELGLQGASLGPSGRDLLAIEMTTPIEPGKGVLPSGRHERWEDWTPVLLQ